MSRNIDHQHPATMTISSTKLHQQIRDIPYFSIFWDDLYEAQQRFVLVSHGFHEYSHKTTSNIERFQQLLFEDYNTWHNNKSIPRYSFYKARARTSFLTFMQSMPLIQNLFGRFTYLSAMECRMLYSQLEMQIDLIFSARHQMSSLSHNEQHQWLESYAIIESIYESIKSNSRQLSNRRDLNPDSCRSRTLSWIPPNHSNSQQTQDYYPSGYLFPVRELAMTSNVTNQQTLTIKQYNTSISSRKLTYINESESSSKESVTSSSITLYPQTLQANNPAEISSVRELAMDITESIPSSTRNSSHIGENDTSNNQNSSIDQISISETSNPNDNSMFMIRKSKSFYFVIPRRSHTIRKWKSRLSNDIKSNRSTASSSSYQEAKIKTQLIMQQQQKSIESAQRSIEEICHLLDKLELVDDPEELKIRNDNIKINKTRMKHEIRSISMQIIDIETLVFKLRRKKQQIVQKLFEPIMMPIVVKRIMAHKQLICQTIRGRQKGKKKRIQ